MNLDNGNLEEPFLEQRARRNRSNDVGRIESESSSDDELAMENQP